MGGPAVIHAYQYAFSSDVQRETGKARFRLATSGGSETNPWLTRGVLRSPPRIAELLLGVAHVAQTRFYTPPAMLARILLAADPVVTSGGDRLRFESFSACCGVYARLDLLPEALDADVRRLGTTNVDFNPPMRAALARVVNSETVVLSVGADRVELERDGKAVIERKVALPIRWLKGFVEVQAYQSRMKLAVEVDGNEARRFIRGLPRQATAATPTWAERSGRGLRLSFRESAGAVPLRGTERLRQLEPLAREAETLRVYTDGGASAWELAFRDSRFVLILSPEPSRGFSGEGQALSDLGRARKFVDLVRGKLRWESRVDADALRREVELDRSEVDAALAALGSRGLVGYDLAETAYFHRELPFDLALVEDLHPRLRAARDLVAEGAVKLGARESHVESGGVVHRVRSTADGPACTCPWYAKYRGRRGPCKHVLAVQLVEEQDVAH